MKGRDLQKPLGQEFVIPIGRAERPSEASWTGFCYTYMKGRETVRNLLDRNLLYLDEGSRNLQKPLGQEFVILI